MPAKINLIGRTFGKLKVIAEAPSVRVSRRTTHRMSLCKCECGKEKIIHNRLLTSGRTSSCGCNAHPGTHGQCRTGKRSGAYKSWNWMLQRCTNPNNDEYFRYGGSGISVCERWMLFENFFADMGPRPPRMEIDRWPNPAGNYEPSNCRWATKSQNNRNKLNTKKFTVRGVTGSLIDLCEHFEVPFPRTRGRIDHGMDIESAIFRPKMFCSRNEAGQFKWASESQPNLQSVANPS